MTSPFEFAKSIFESPGDDIQDGKLKVTDMNRFMMLKSIAFSIDGVLFADFFQDRGNIPADLLFTSLHQCIQPKTRRFNKWIKPKREIDKAEIDYVVELLKTSTNSAVMIIEDLSDEERKKLTDTVKEFNKKK